MLASIFGIEAEVKQTSVNDRLARKKCMGGMEVGVRDDGQDDEQVPHDSDQVYAQEGDK